jgi:uncharacterized protein
MQMPMRGDCNSSLRRLLITRPLASIGVTVIKLQLALIAGAVGFVTPLVCAPALAETQGAVRSLLEFRRDGVMIQQWDLSCAAAALGTLLQYEFGESLTEKEIARGLMNRREYLEHPEFVRVREGFSLLDLKHYVQTLGYKGLGYPGLDLNDLIENAPIMVPINAFGYNHFVIFRGAMGNRVLLADPAWGNRTMTIEKFEQMWLDFGEPMGHVGFVIERADGGKPPSRLQPKPTEFVTLR